MHTHIQHTLACLFWLVFLNNFPGYTQKLVKDIWPGKESSYPNQLTSVNGKLYFVTNDGVHGRELWRSDGTMEGTRMIADIIPGKGDGEVNNLTHVNEELYFTATNPVIKGYSKLWMLDSKSDTPIELSDGIHNPLESINPANLTQVGGKLYYTNSLALGGNGSKGLLRVDDIKVPIAKIVDTFPFEAPDFFMPSQLTDFNGTLYFIYKGGLRKLAPTDTKSVEVLSVVKGKNLDSKIMGLTKCGSKLFFTADTEGAGRLWVSDGTSTGTRQLKDGISFWQTAPNPANLTEVNGTLYYSSAIYKGGYSYWGIFKSNGSDFPGTRFFASFVRSSIDIALGSDTNVPYNPSATPNGGSSPTHFINVNGILYFVFAGNLWKSDGTAAGTVKIPNTIYPTNLTNVDGKLYFVNSHTAICKTDPSSTSMTVLYKARYRISNLTHVNESIFYHLARASTLSTGSELYKFSKP